MSQMFKFYLTTPLRLWIKVRAYPFIKCSKCGARLARKWDLKLLVSIVLATGVLVLLSKGLSPFLAFVLIAAIMIIDGFSCKLKEV